MSRVRVIKIYVTESTLRKVGIAKDDLESEIYESEIYGMIKARYGVDAMDIVLKTFIYAKRMFPISDSNAKKEQRNLGRPSRIYLC